MPFGASTFASGKNARIAKIAVIRGTVTSVSRWTVMTRRTGVPGWAIDARGTAVGTAAAPAPGPAAAAAAAAAAYARMTRSSLIQWMAGQVPDEQNDSPLDRSSLMKPIINSLIPTHNPIERKLFADEIPAYAAGVSTIFREPDATVGVQMERLQITFDVAPKIKQWLIVIAVPEAGFGTGKMGGTL